METSIFASQAAHFIYQCDVRLRLLEIQTAFLLYICIYPLHAICHFPLPTSMSPDQKYVLWFDLTAVRPPQNHQTS